MKILCPVCGYPNLHEAPYDEKGCSSFEICPCCGTEFGYTDFVKEARDLERKWDMLREKWIKDGAKWFRTSKKPSNWKMENQLRNIRK